MRCDARHTGRVLGDVSDLDEDIVLLQLGDGDLLDRSGLSLKGPGRGKRQRAGGIQSVVRCAVEPGTVTLTDWSSTRARILPGISMDILV